jgi:hypothetical protein
VHVERDVDVIVVEIASRRKSVSCSRQGKAAMSSRDC